MNGIEIIGCNGKNIGDILMLEAAVQEIRNRNPSAEFSVRRRSLLRRVRPLTRLNHLPLIRPSFRKQRIHEAVNDTLLAPLSNLAGVLPRLMADRHIFGIIDVCGYKYGGVWGGDAIQADLQTFSREKRRGRKVVLLPKTFGPFANKRDAEAMRKLIDLCDLSFARDETSQKHLMSAGVPTAKCPVFPDYTTTVSGTQDPAHQEFSGRAMIIPNFRMVDSHDFDERTYAGYLGELATHLTGRNLDPLILVHDAGRDLAFSQAFARERNLQVIVEKRATVVKGLIASAEFVYSDRLHGLINALSQSVPAVTSGWNYKYAEILKTYDLPELLSAPGKHSSDALLDRVNTALDHSGAIRNRLAVTAARIKLQNTEMWNIVATCLFGGD